MKKNEFVSLVAERTDMSKKDTEKVIDAAFAAIGDLMMQGDRLVLSGFGSFETKVRAARSGRNPRHGRGDRDRTGDAAGVQGRPHTQDKVERKMRLDKYLKVSRLIKRRTVANDACDAARITVNGKSAKAFLSGQDGRHHRDRLRPAHDEGRGARDRGARTQGRCRRNVPRNPVKPVLKTLFHAYNCCVKRVFALRKGVGSMAEKRRRADAQHSAGGTRKAARDGRSAMCRALTRSRCCSRRGRAC